MNEQDRYLNDFAIRSFRDTADHEYIVARLAYRAKLFPQFLWSSLHALEKYLKCMLVLNRVRAPNGHNLAKILREFELQGAFELRVSPDTASFFEYLDTVGPFRYFEGSWYLKGIELVHLDRAVWEVRRYARPLRYELGAEAGEPADSLAVELDRIRRSESEHPQQFSIPGGKLEQILTDRKHPARAGLVWQNGFFGESRRRTVRVPFGLHAANAPLTLKPDLVDLVTQYAYLPKDVAGAYRELARRTEVERSQHQQS